MVEICSIGSLLERKRTKAKDKYHNVPVYAVTNNRGFVLSSSLHDFDIFSDDTSNYMVVSKNDFAYNPSRLNVGSIAYFKEDGNGLISPMYVVFHADENKILAEYLYIVIKSEFVRNKIDALKEVGARFRFDFNRWGLIKIPIPSLEEQTRIVGILDTFTSAIDNLKEQIAQRRRQYEYYRDQLLDLEGKPGVEMKTLGELSYKISSGRNKNKEDQGQYPVFGSTGIIAYTNSYLFDKPLILVARVGANAGYVYMINEKCDVTDNTLIVETKEDNNRKFIFYYLVYMNINQFAKGGGQPLITGGAFKRPPHPPPSSLRAAANSLYPRHLRGIYTELGSAAKAARKAI